HARRTGAHQQVLSAFAPARPWARAAVARPAGEPDQQQARPEEQPRHRAHGSALRGQQGSEVEAGPTEAVLTGREPAPAVQLAVLTAGEDLGDLDHAVLGAAGDGGDLPHAPTSGAVQL